MPISKYRRFFFSPEIGCIGGDDCNCLLNCLYLDLFTQQFLRILSISMREKKMKGLFYFRGYFPYYFLIINARFLLINP